jgi:hypothetical protein
MRDLIDGIKESRSLEDFSIANTGCGPSVGHWIVQLLIVCSSWIKLNISNCRLRNSMTEIAQGLPESTSLRRLSVARNELFHG